jgi:hypothetical protein
MFAGSLASAAQTGLSAKDIMIKNDEARKLTQAEAQAKMTTGTADGASRAKEFTWWRKLKDDNVHSDTLTRFHFPPEIKKEGILFLGSAEATDIQIYLPAYKKVRRVETGQQSGSFMGSEFSYADIDPPLVDDYEYQLLREEPCAGTVAKSVKCWVIESKPAREQVKDRTGISKGTTWIRQDNFMASQAEYLDFDGQPWKKLEVFETKEVDQKNHKWMSTSLKMTNQKNSKTTSLVFEGVKVDKKVPASTFTVQNLSRE